jgi:hypothetical protein
MIDRYREPRVALKQSDAGVDGLLNLVPGQGSTQVFIRLQAMWKVGDVLLNGRGYLLPPAIYAVCVLPNRPVRECWQATDRHFHAAPE